jgi:hypothetical protein
MNKQRLGDIQREISALREQISALRDEEKKIKALLAKKKVRASVSERLRKDKDFVDRFIHGESMAEIARREGVSPTCVRQRLFRGWKYNYPRHYAENRGEGALSLRTRAIQERLHLLDNGANSETRHKKHPFSP